MVKYWHSMGVLFLKINLLLIFFAGPHCAQKIYPVPAMEMEILQFVNEDRKSHGLSALQMNPMESSLAEQHSRNMSVGKVKFGHDGFKKRAKTIQQQLGSTEVGENVASGQMSAREVVDGWLHSPGHKKNIEGDFTLTGIGYASDRKGNIYFTEIFSR